MKFKEQLNRDGVDTMPCVTGFARGCAVREVVERFGINTTLKWSGKTGQRAKMYPTLKTG